MKHILSIQSHVAYGYVGNRAAVFPLQRLGFDVIAINTVQFSNHTGYGQWEGDIFSRDHLERLLRGIEARGGLAHLAALLTGYMGSAELGELMLRTAQQLKQRDNDFLYCCDPVIGDVGRGIFVQAGVAEFFKSSLVQQATILTPNQFELEYLTDSAIHSLHDAVNACNQLRKAGPNIILLTSLIHNRTTVDTIEMLVNTAQGSWRVITPKLPFDSAPNGAGDATAAIFLANYLQTKDVITTLKNTAAAIFAIFRKTHQLGRRELALIQAQDAIVSPEQPFAIEQVS